MTQEEKAKAYDEALERARKMLNMILDSELLGFPDQIREIFPQLRESEDEKIRKSIEGAIRVYGKTQGEWIGGYDVDTLVVHLREAFGALEKRKEASKAIEAVEKIDKYIDEHVENAYDMKDSHPDKKYCQGIDDTLAGIAGILQDVYSEKENKFAPQVLPCSAAWFEDGDEKQKEQKFDSLIYDKDLDKAAREFYLSGSADSPIDSTGLVPIVRMAEFGATWMKERMEKEQKPAEVDEYEIIKKHITGDSLSSEVNKRLKECGWYVTDEKPVEWDKDDERRRDGIIQWLREYQAKFNPKYDSLSIESIESLIDWFKSLHLQLKQEGSISPEDGDIVVNKDGVIAMFESWGHHPDGGSFNDHSYFFAKCTLDKENGYNEVDCHPDSYGLRYATSEEMMKLMPYLLCSPSYKEAHWKPSEEQIEVLKWCKPLFYDPKLKKILESLIDDLEKLM